MRKKKIEELSVPAGESAAETPVREQPKPIRREVIGFEFTTPALKPTPGGDCPLGKRAKWTPKDMKHYKLTAFLDSCYPGLLFVGRWAVPLSALKHVEFE